MSLHDPLRGPWLKIDRSGHHIEDFNTRFEAWQAEGPYELVTDFNSERTEQIIKIRRRSHFPDELIAITADAIHNLRTALDQLAFALASKIAVCVNVRVLSKTYFPTGNDRNAFETRIREGIELGRFNDTIAKFFTRIEPYPGGHGEALFALNELDNVDKHRSGVDLHSADMLRIRQLLPSQRWMLLDLSTGEEVEVARHPAGTEPKYDPKVFYTVLLGKVDRVERQSLQALGKYRKLVTEILNTAEELFFA